MSDPAYNVGVIVTIDGVAASGKSSVAARVAAALGVPFLSSGLLYRAATHLAQEADLSLTDEAPLLAHLNTHPVTLHPQVGGNEAWQGERDLTPHLHTAQVDAGVSPVALLPGVRAWVNAQLRQAAPPFVAEGRDMGTAVFPHATAKFFLTADPTVRARRRAAERPQDVAAIEAALRARDAHDAAQSVPAEDAELLDTSHLNLDEVVNHILAAVRRTERA